MSVRVNLLHPEEIKSQHGVSKETLIRGGGGLAAVLLAAGAAYLIVSVRGVLHGHAQAQSQWAAVEVDYNRIMDVQKTHQGNQKYIGELEGWTNSRLDWKDALDDMQARVPASIQLNRFSISSSISISVAEPAVDKDPGTPARKFSISMGGIAQGDLSDKDVIQFVDSLRTAEHLQPWLASMKLQGLQRASRGMNDGEDEKRTFRVDATSMERLMK